jgi:DNA repair exonuclease SbcCD nuclease subunit
MINVIAIGDQHFKVSNIKEVNLFIEKITFLIKEKKPDFVVLLGDLLDTHERLHITPLNKAYELIDNIRKICKTYVLVGNHDMENNSVYLNDKHWLNSLKQWDNVTIVDKVIKENNFIFVPYVFVGRFEEALNTLNEDWKNNINCIFAHQEFKGCKMGAFDSIDGDIWDINNPNVISGHIHSNQTPQKNIYYPGSSLPVAFGESAKNIIGYV